jgi:hypothetical protein
LHALKSPAVARAVLVDRTPIVLAEKSTAAVNVGEDALLDWCGTGFDENARRESSESAALVFAVEQDGVVVPVLLAA